MTVNGTMSFGNIRINIFFMKKTLIALLLLVHISAYNQTRSWRIIDKMTLIAMVASANFSLGYQFGTEKNSRATFDLDMIYSKDFCQLDSTTRMDRMREVFYLINHYAFKDSIEYLDSVLIHTYSDSGCSYVYSSKNIKVDKTDDVDVLLAKIVKIVPFNCRAILDLTTRDRILFEVNTDTPLLDINVDGKRPGVYDPYVEDFFLAVAALVYEVVAKGNMKEYNKMIIIRKEGGKIVKLTHFNFSDPVFVNLYQNDLYNQQQLPRRVQKIDIKKLESFQKER
jgi:hypothetical protein